MCPNGISFTAFVTESFVAADKEASASMIFQNIAGIDMNKVWTSAGFIDRIYS